MKISKIILYNEPSVPEINIKRAKKFNLKKPFQKHTPSIEDILIESENKDMSNKEEMTLYDGIELNKIMREVIPVAENTLNTLHIIF